VTPTANTSEISYNVDYIDNSTPARPTITSDTHTSDVWSQDDDAVLTVNMEEPTANQSPRYNEYCVGEICRDSDYTRLPSDNIIP